jgi:hypothetical protein
VLNLHSAIKNPKFIDDPITRLLNDLFFNFFSSFEPLQREEVTAQVIEAVREAVKNG